MNKKKLARAVALLCLIAAAILCASLICSPLFHPGHIFYDDDLLVQENESHHSTKSRGIVLNDSQQDFSLGGFSGVRTVNIIALTENQTLSYSWSVAVEKGNFKIVLVDNTNAEIVNTIWEGSGSGSVKDCELPPGEYRVKFAGDRATVNSTFSIEKN